MFKGMVKNLKSLPKKNPFKKKPKIPLEDSKESITREDFEQLFPYKILDSIGKKKVKKLSEVPDLEPSKIKELVLVNRVKAADKSSKHVNYPFSNVIEAIGPYKLLA